MKHLIVRNLGPIKQADVELKRYNVFIGPQSSGKSTMAKVLSTCEWIEKEVVTSRNESVIGDGEAFKDLVERFHRTQGYFNEQSYVMYETECVKILYEKESLSISLNRKTDYTRQKICYIPSERNMVTLSELQGFEFGNNNLRSFLFDWYKAREYYNPINKTDILRLGIQYYYDKQLDKSGDRIVVEGDMGNDITLSDSSSGLQSVVPLIVMSQYYTGQYFKDYPLSFSNVRSNEEQRTRDAITREIILPQYKNEGENDVKTLVRFFEDLKKQETEARKLWRKYDDTCKHLLIPNRTTFIIEEPEQNLYPFTQVALIESIVKLCCGGERLHGFTLTTHSPFVLSCLNVMIMRYYKQDKNGATFNPSDLTAFIMQDGCLTTLMQEDVQSERISVDMEDLTEAMRAMLSEYRSLKEM